jgi:periplasmic divalent cation tolerance protein
LFIIRFDRIANLILQMTDKILALSTCGSAEEAERIARGLVEARLAACVNIVPGLRSIYRWQGAVEDAGEWLLLIKSRRDLLEPLEAELRRLHSYEVPEMIAVAIVDGAPDYLAWMDAEVEGTSE